jgi:hypothetical protein
MPTTFHRARRLLAAGAIAGVAVFGVAACENTGEGGGGSVDSEEMSEEPMEDGMEESEEMTDDMSEEPMEEDMSEEDSMEEDMSEEPMSEEPMDDEG